MRFARTFGRKLTSDPLDSGICQLACWAASLLVLGLGFYKLAALRLTEPELFFGVLLVLALGLL